jgi:hypothetical protein
MDAASLKVERHDPNADPFEFKEHPRSSYATVTLLSK